MARTQLYIAQSLDGYIADAEGGVRWLEERGQGGDFGYSDFLEQVGAIAMGAATYEQILSWGIDWPYAGKPTWVFTHRELRTVPNADLRFTSAPIAEVHRELLEAADGKNVWIVGGGDVAASSRTRAPRRRARDDRAGHARARGAAIAAAARVAAGGDGAQRRLRRGAVRRRPLMASRESGAPVRAA